MALRIIAGRGTSRACLQLSMLVLLPVWGAAEFGPYVAATGTFSWLVFAVIGVEKAALTLLPRTRVLTAHFTRMLLLRAAAPLAGTLLAALVLLPVGGALALYSAAAAFAAAQGLLTTLASVHRLAGHPERDSAAFVGSAVWVAAMATLAVVGVLSPYGYLLALVAGLTLDCAILALLVPALRGRPARTRSGRSLGRVVNRRVVLLGLSDVADNAGVSVLYVVLAASSPPADAALVYVMLIVSSVLGSLGMLVLRLLQPTTSLKLRGAGGADGRRRARRITGWSTAVSGSVVLVATIGAVYAYTTGGTARLASIGSDRVALGITLAVEMTVFCAIMYAVYLLENTNGAVLSLTSSSAVAGLVTTAVAAVLAIPVLHAVGAILALVVGLATKGIVLTVRLRRELPTAPITAAPDAVVLPG